MTEFVHKFDSSDPFDLLIAEFQFVAQPQGSPVRFLEGLTVHFISKDGLGVMKMFDLVAVVVGAGVRPRSHTEGVEDGVPRPGFGTDPGEKVG